MKAKPIPQELQEMVIKDFLGEEIDIRRIKKKYNISQWIFDRILKENNIENKFSLKRSSGRKYFFKEDIFSNIDHQDKAYFLGVLMSDGWVRRSKCNYSVNLKMTDYEVIENFNRFMGGNKTIKTHPIRKKMRKPSYEINFASKKLVSDLLKYGFSEKKAYRTHIPDIPENLIPHFIRGYLDGDGGIFCHPDKSMHCLSIHSCSLLILEQIQDFFKSRLLLNNGNHIYLNNNKNCHKFTVNTFKEILNIGRLIYKDANLKLYRKYRNFLKIEEKYLKFNKSKKARSRYFGVSYYTNKGKKQHWRAEVKYNKQRYFLGSFYTEQDAAKAYNDKILELGLENERPLNILDANPQ